MTHVFIYGTLQPGQRNWPILAPYAQTWTPATIWGFELWDLPEGYPAITPGEGVVRGLAVELKDGNALDALDALDALEGHRAGDPTSLYLRRLLQVVLDGQAPPRTLRAYTYTIHPSRREHMRQRAARVHGGQWPPPATEPSS